MNDATRELGAALGVAVLGSLAASHYGQVVDRLVAGLPSGQQTSATSSLAGAIETASQLPAAAGRLLTTGAQQAFIGGIHEAVTVGAVLAAISAVAVYRWLPHQLAAEGAMHGSVESVEDAAELGIAGVPPIFADELTDELADGEARSEPSAAPIPAQ